MRKIQIILGVLVALFFMSCEQHQPNVLFILVDDLGYSDVGYVGIKLDVNTPNIVQLRKESMLFPNAYTASPVCSPTRASIMTGKYPSSLKLTCQISGMGMEEYQRKHSVGKLFLEAACIDRLPLEEVTIAEVLKGNGYSTGFFGKWHLASEEALSMTDGNLDECFNPQYQGFDVTEDVYGQFVNLFSPNKNVAMNDELNGKCLTERLTDDAIKYMRNSKDKPFFCFLSYYSDEMFSQSTEGELNSNDAMVDAVDKNIGRLMSNLDRAGKIDNTLIILYSDNGGITENTPLRGKKGSLYEGGIRVPLLVSYPKVIPANSTNETPVISNDFFPTLLDAANIPVRQYSSGVEGLSFYPLLTQKAKSLSKRPLYWHFPHYRNVPMAMASAIRDGEWKLIYEYEDKNISLFNLKYDPYEQYNLVYIEKDKVKELVDKLLKWQVDTNVSMPQINPDF